MAANAVNGGGWGVSRTRVAAWAAVVASILLIPLVGMQFSEEVKWGVFDFVFMGLLLLGSALAYELISSKGGTVAYRVATGIASVAAVLLVWVNAAVGVIGEENPANALYALVLMVGIIGAFIARFEPQGMSRTLFVVALAQALVPVVALIFWRRDFSPGVVPVFVLNGVFVTLFVVSALLYRETARGKLERVSV